MTVMAISCTVEEIVDPNDGIVPAADETFYAYTEDRSYDEATKAYVDVDAQNSHHIYWNKDDRITVFNRAANGSEYAFQGDDGSTEGEFKKVQSVNSSASGNPLPCAYAVYPYSSETAIQSDGKISFIIPSTQYYLKDDSFGKDANVMVAKTDNNILKFNNAVGYLTLRLYGNRSMSISSITLEGKGEILAGPCEIDMSGDKPSLTMKDGDDAVTKIRLFCKDVVELSTSSSNCKEFWFVLPPMTFSAGFTVTVATSDGGVVSKSMTNQLTIERNKVSRMAPFQVRASADNNLKINSLTKVYGIERKTIQQGWSTTTTLVDKSYTASLGSDNLTYTFTMPTYTDFQHFKMDFSISGGTGTVLKANDKIIVSGETEFDASQPVALAVCNGDKEKRYTLIVRNTGLPVVRITTVGDGFTLDKLESYKNSLQTNGTDQRIWLPDATIAEQSGWSASVRIDLPDGVKDCEVATQIKGRGNYTWKWDKKPYALKFSEGKEVLGMPAHKRWILLANWRDRTLLRNDAAFWLSKQTPEKDVTQGLPYTVRGQFVELEFNGEHRGNYYLCEQIKIDQNRVAITKINKKAGSADLSGGYLMEIDSYWDEVNKFKSSEFGLKYMFKEPDDPKTDVIDDKTSYTYQDAYTWMQNYINKFEQALKTQSSFAGPEPPLYKSYLDVDSAIYFMLLNELTGNRDFFQNGDDTHFGPHSTYLYKDKGGLLFMGPGWDFDYETFISQDYIDQNSDNGWRGFAKTGYYYYYLCYDPSFVQRIKDLWNLTMPKFQELPAHINKMATKISLSQQFDQELWPYAKSTDKARRNDNHDYYENGDVVPFQTAVERMITNFNARVNWMNTEIKSDSFTTTSPF